MIFDLLKDSSPNRPRCPSSLSFAFRSRAYSGFLQFILDEFGTKIKDQLTMVCLGIVPVFHFHSSSGQSLRVCSSLVPAMECITYSTPPKSKLVTHYQQDSSNCMHSSHYSITTRHPTKRYRIPTVRLPGVSKSFFDLSMISQRSEKPRKQ